MALVTGASRGLGRGIAVALAGAGYHVAGVARDRAALAELHAQLGERFTPVRADAADPVAAGELIDAYRPAVLVLNAGAPPLPRPLHRHTWETFSRTWEVDVKLGQVLTPEHAGKAVADLVSGSAIGPGRAEAGSFLLTGAGLTPLPEPG